MMVAEFVPAPPKEEPVDGADPARVPCTDDGDDGDDDGEDALSLCNLSLYCDAADNSFADDEASTSSSSSSSSSSDHDGFFEFSSVGGSDSSSDLGSGDRSIVFCGKLIPPRESPPPAAPEKKKSPSRSTRSPTVRRRKCRWYLMAFGLARFPTEMAMSEMRTRQSRNAERAGSCGGAGEVVRSGDCGDESKAKGLFGLLKALGSGHRRRAHAFVKASLGCVARV
ncbi:hypothetical protein ACJRO7_004029 [Eucalyptus globulus]|uniref:Uncharacterized protein n=1 Tax=Eucalyptus globulus TaxID=34317 RepID=A0ABD3IY42_EUCGL